MPADPYPYELATPAQRALGTPWVAVHHTIPVEPLTEPVENRVAFIRAHKPVHEIETRLRALRPASPALVAARAEFARVTEAAQDEFERVTATAQDEFERVTAAAWAEVARVTAPALAALLAVLAVECPDIAWGPDGLVFPVPETEVPHAG